MTTRRHDPAEVGRPDLTVRNICLQDGLEQSEASGVVSSSFRPLGMVGVTGHFFGGEGLVREEGGYYVSGERDSGLLSGPEATAVEHTGATPVYL